MMELTRLTPQAPRGWLHGQGGQEWHQSPRRKAGSVKSPSSRAFLPLHSVGDVFLVLCAFKEEVMMDRQRGEEMKEARKPIRTLLPPQILC